MIENLVDQYISDTYGLVVQYESGSFYDGFGNFIQNVGSGSSNTDTGSFVTTSSFNSFTSSINAYTESLNTATSSFVRNSQTSSMSVLSASFAVSSSYSTNINGSTNHIPVFNSPNSLVTSSIYQSGSYSIIINQDNNTTAAPEALYVYQPSSTSYNVISGKGNLNNYLQLNIQNTNQGTNASSDVVATAGNGNETSNYIDMGINSDNFSGDIGGPNDAYLYSTGNDLHIGNATPNKPIQFFAGGINVETNKKLQLNANGQHSMTGSLSVTQGITASLFGNASTSTTASFAVNASSANNASTSTTASYAANAANAANATFATTAGNGGVTNIVAGSGITLIPTSGVGAVTVISSGGGGVTIISGSNVTQSFSNSSTWTFNHNLGTRTPIITVFDTNYNQIIPQNIELTNISSSTITFPTVESGFAVASLGGATGTVLSSSYALFSTYAATASNYAETDPVFTAKSASFATTGSNRFVGNQIITGSLIVSGSSTFTNIGPAIFSGSVNISGSTTILGTTNFSNTTTTITGSFLVTGSTTQIGNNTLTGNTSLSGSINISGSSTIRGTTVMSGSLNISGSTTQTGNNTLIGTTTLTGSINISGDIIPTASSSFDLGSITNPWRSLYVQSGSISIQSDIPGGIPAVISNANGNVSIAAAGFQLKSGSYIPFEVSTTARTIIRVPNIPANDVGGLSIIGSSDGSYQGVTNAGGLLHLTSNDGASSRITSDAFGTTAFAAYVGRKARGTAASPLPVQSNDTLSRISSIGWTGPEYGFTMSASLTTAPTSIDVIALENFTTSSFGTAFKFFNSPLGNTTRVLTAQIDATGIQTSGSVRAASFTGSFSGSLVGTAVNAQTASYVNPLNQNVVITGSLLVSGSTIHTGSLTLSSGSALAINDGFYVNGNKQFNYGQFSSTQTQSGSANTAYSATFTTTDFSQGVSLVSGSRITVSNTGLYNVQFSAQLHTTSNEAVDFSVWFAMTGSNIADSNTDFSIEKINGGGFQVAALNFLTQIASGSYVELKFSKTTTNGQLQAKGTQSTPTRPATPSVILTVTQVA
jgi:hypothetical protein